MEQFETRFKQVDVFPMVKHYMDELDLFNLFKKFVPAASVSLADHAESLCILTANIICDNKPLYKVQEWLSKYSDGFVSNRQKRVSSMMIGSPDHFQRFFIQTAIR